MTESVQKTVATSKIPMPQLKYSINLVPVQSDRVKI
jgi:hypothetical protein